MKKTAILFCAGLILYSCATVPLTGRNRLSLVSNGEIIPLVNEQEDEVLKENKVVTNTAEGQKILKVGKRMADAVESYLVSQGYQDLAKSFAWEFNLLENESVNAW